MPEVLRQIKTYLPANKKLFAGGRSANEKLFAIDSPENKAFGSGYSNETRHVLVKYGHVLKHTGHVLVQGQIPLDCFWSRLDMFWTTHKICFYKFYKKGALTFEFEKKRNAAFFKMIYLNSWAKNIHGI